MYVRNKFSSFILITLFIILLIFYINLIIASDKESIKFDYNSNNVKIVFKGEISNKDIFGDNSKITDYVFPINESEKIQGKYFNQNPNWLKFEYTINNNKKTVLVAKQPIMNYVSWDDLARGGLISGDGSLIEVNGISFAQDSKVVGVDGSIYSVRLLDCGNFTMDNLSEWNLLIGSVHQGDLDFKGDYFGWIKNPYSDEDLKLGFNGSLNWCQNNWSEKEDYKINRGYFLVSRFHATPSNFSGERIFWRPVLELINDDQNKVESKIIKPSYEKELLERSNDVFFLGEISNDQIFGSNRKITDLFSINEGVILNETPDWLHFKKDDKELLVAKNPILRSVSWNSLAKAGLVFGDDSFINIDGVNFSQDAKITAIDGLTYSVRLLNCGNFTMDNSSEWNLLIGGVHKGDGDFNSFKFSEFSFIDDLYDDKDLKVGLEGFGTSTWCKEAKLIDDKLFAVNRGYFTVSRFHLTETDFIGNAFSWRPVLELIKN